MADGLNGGTLLGANDLQRTIDANTKAVADLTSAVADMRKSNSRGSGGFALGPMMSSGTPNGGGATYAGIPSMGAPSGPVAPSGTSMSAMGAAAAGNIRWGFSAGMSEDAMRDARAAFDLTRKVNGGYRGASTNEQWLKDAGLKRVTSFNAMDNAAAGLMVSNTWGQSAGTQRRMNTMAGAIGVLDPTMSAVQQTQVMGQFGAMPMTNNLQMFGINTYSNGKQRSVVQIAKDILRRSGWHEGMKMTPEQIDASIIAPNSSFQSNLAMLGLSPDMVSSVTKAAADLVRANQTGMTSQKFDKLVQTAGQDSSAGKAARKELSRAGIKQVDSIIQTNKTHATNESEAATEGLDAFAASLKATTAMLDLFQDSIRGIPLIGDVMAANQGSGGLLGKAFGFATGGAGRMLGLGGIGLGGGGLSMPGGESGLTNLASLGGGSSSAFAATGLAAGFSGSFFGGYSEAAALSGFGGGGSAGPSASTTTSSPSTRGSMGGGGFGLSGGGGGGSAPSSGGQYPNSGFGGVKPWVARAGHEIQRKFGIKSVGGVGKRSNTSDHPSGHALDFMCTGRTGDNLAAYAQANAARLGITYVIWKQRIWNRSRAREGWRQMEDRGSITANHFDHVHVSFQYTDPDPQATRAGSGTGGVSSGGGGGTPTQNKSLGRQMAAARGWTGNQWAALEALWTQESGWRHTADNPTSSAYGIPQALIAMHQMPKGYYDRKTGSGAGTQGHGGNPRVQIEWGLNYIAGRYGTPAKAWDFHKRNNWYDKGAWEIKQDEDARVHKGEMILSKPAAEQVRDVLQKQAGINDGKSSSGTGVVLDFKPGSIVISVGAGTSVSSGRGLATEFVKALAADERIKALQAGNG